MHFFSKKTVAAYNTAIVVNAEAEVCVLSRPGLSILCFLYYVYYVG
jgi:hypothetical protein